MLRFERRLQRSRRRPVSKLRLSLDYLASTYGMNVLLTAHITVDRDGKKVLVLEGDNVKPA